MIQDSGLRWLCRSQWGQHWLKIWSFFLRIFFSELDETSKLHKRIQSIDSFLRFQLRSNFIIFCQLHQPILHFLLSLKTLQYLSRLYAPFEGYPSFKVTKDAVLSPVVLEALYAIQLDFRWNWCVAKFVNNYPVKKSINFLI